METDLQIDIHIEDMDDIEDVDIEDIDLDDLYEENLISLLLLHVIYKEIENYQAIIIQRSFRRYRLHKFLNFNAHKKKYKDILDDIFDFSYSPPFHDSQLPLLRHGGFNYRWVHKRFNLNNKELFSL